MTDRPRRAARGKANYRIALIALVVLAGIVRISAIAYTHATAAAPEENRIIARNLADGRGFTFTEFGVTGPTAVRGPAYPMLLAIVGPDRVKLILTINVIAGMATVLAAFALTRILMSPPAPISVAVELARDVSAQEPRASSTATPNAHRAAWAAAALFAVWPTQIYAATLTQGLSIAVLLTLAALALAFRRTPPALLVGGVFAGIAALTEPTLALPLLLVAIAIGWRRHWPDAALYVATGLVVVAPWLYRNAVVFGGPMPITSNFWRDAFLGNGPDPVGANPTTASFEMRGSTVFPKSRIELLLPSDFDQLKQPEPQRVATFRQWTSDWARQHPADYLGRCAKRTYVVLSGQYEHALANHALFSLFYIFEWASAIAILLPRYKSELRMLAIVFACGLILPMIFTTAEARFVPLLDVPLLLACVGSGSPPKQSTAAAGK